MTDFKKVLETQKTNTKLLHNLVSECNSWDGSLDGYQVYDFDDDFFDTFFEGKPEEAARATFFGNIQNWLDEFIRFNGYGNLESLSSHQLNKELQAGADEIIERALELYEENHIDLEDILNSHDIEGIK